MTQNKKQTKGRDNVLQISELLKHHSMFHEKRGMSYSQRLMGNGVFRLTTSMQENDL